MWRPVFRIKKSTRDAKPNAFVELSIQYALMAIDVLLKCENGRLGKSHFVCVCVVVWSFFFIFFFLYI